MFHVEHTAGGWRAAAAIAVSVRLLRPGHGGIRRVRPCFPEASAGGGSGPALDAAGAGGPRGR